MLCCIICRLFLSSLMIYQLTLSSEAFETAPGEHELSQQGLPVILAGPELLLQPRRRPLG